MISNVVVVRIPAFYLSLLIFVGQVFTGLVIDTIIDGMFSIQILIGGILVTVGLCVDLLFDKIEKNEAGIENEEKQGSPVQEPDTETG
jgi:transporter family-2 protein